jgi:hypothetical protein
MFEMFVTGPVTSGAGVIRHCIQCRAKRDASIPCTGFGPGCFSSAPLPPAQRPPALAP